jgi:hypothetical protein
MPSNLAVNPDETFATGGDCGTLRADVARRRAAAMWRERRGDSMSPAMPLPVPTQSAARAEMRVPTPLQSVVHCAVVAAGFTLLFAVFFSPVWRSARLLAPGDGFSEYLPIFRTQPGLWTPLLFGGFPAAADPQSQSFYPPARLLALSGAWNSYVVSAYVLAACFAYGYAFTLTRSVAAALGTGLVYSMSGFFMAHLGHTTMVHTAAWMPLLLWALERVRRGGGGAWVLLVSVAVGAGAVAGHPQMFCYTMITGVAYVVVVARSAATGAWRYCRTTLIALAVGLGLAAVQLLPAVELAALSQRATSDFRTFVSFALPWRESIQLLFPYLFGSGAQGVYRVPYFGTWGITETAGYCGILPLGLALIGVMANRADPLRRFWTAVAILSVLLALGAATPLARIAFLIPGYNRFRCAGRHFVLLSFAVAVLAGLGIAALQRRGADIRCVTGRAAVAVLALVGTGVVLIAFTHASLQAAAVRHGVAALSVSPLENPALGIPLGIAALSALALVWFARTAAGRLGFALLLILVALDLGSFGFFCEWRFWAPHHDELEMPALVRGREGQIVSSGSRIFSFLGPVGSREAGPPNLSLMWGIPSADGYTPLALQRAAHALPFADSASLSPDNRVLDVLAVRYLLVPYRALANFGLQDRVGTLLDAQPVTGAGMAQTPRWCHVEDRNDVGLYENQHAMPRAWTVSHAVALPREAILRTLQNSVMPDGTVFDPRDTALVEAPVELPVSEAAHAAQISSVRDRGTEVLVAVQTAAATFLVLSDTYYPGWRVTIDDHPADVHRTDYLLRGVVVPRGEHTIRFSFVPLSFYCGLGVSALALLALPTVRRW